jgi:hypothetical protein
VIFNAETDNGGQTSWADFRLGAGQTYATSVPGFSTVDLVLINNRGDMAFRDPVGEGVYFLPEGASSAVKIARTGDPSPIAGRTYWVPTGPLALSDAGDITFTTGLKDQVTQSVNDALFLYSDAIGLPATIIAEDMITGTPVGGTFTINDPTVNAITQDGDVVFLTSVNGGASAGGFFRFLRTGGFTKIVVAGDAAPASIGGTMNNLGFIDLKFVSGRQLVFRSLVTNGSAADAILVKADVTKASLTDLRVVAQEGQATGTEIGGVFANQQNQPFGLGIAPQIRGDGGVLFSSYVAAARGGVPINRGIVFLWTGRGFKKILGDGDRLPSGQTVRPSRYMMNDAGQIVIFPREIN